MSWYELPISNPNTVTGQVKYGSDQTKLISRLFNGENLSSTHPVNIGTNTTFDSERLRIRAPSSGFSYIIQGQNITADRILRLPLMTGTGEIALSAAGAANDWGNATQTFRNQFLEIRNPANTFSYIVNTSAISADRNIILPVLPADDTITFNNATQTLSNKTLNNVTFAAITINTDTNTIKNSATNIPGDILVNNGSKFVRFPKGTAGQALAVKDDGSGIEWSSSVSGTPGPAGPEGPAGPTGATGPAGPAGGLALPEVGEQISGTWYATSAIGASGIWSGFLTNLSNVTPTNITDTSGRIGLRYALTSDDDTAGFRTNDEFVSRNNDIELWVRYKIDLNGQDAEYRIGIGFINDVTNDLNADNALNSDQGFMWYKDSLDSTIEIGHNDGDTTMNRTSSVSLTATNESIHTIHLISEASNNRFGISLDGAGFSYVTTEIPSSTARLGCIVLIRNEDANDRFVEYYGSYFKATVI